MNEEKVDLKTRCNTLNPPTPLTCTSCQKVILIKDPLLNSTLKPRPTSSSKSFMLKWKLIKKYLVKWESHPLKIKATWFGWRSKQTVVCISTKDYYDDTIRAPLEGTGKTRFIQLKNISLVFFLLKIDPPLMEYTVCRRNNECRHYAICQVGFEGFFWKSFQ